MLLSSLQLCCGRYGTINPWLVVLKTLLVSWNATNSWLRYIREIQEQLLRASCIFKDMEQPTPQFVATEAPTSTFLGSASIPEHECSVKLRLIKFHSKRAQRIRRMKWHWPLNTHRCKFRVYRVQSHPQRALLVCNHTKSNVHRLSTHLTPSLLFF